MDPDQAPAGFPTTRWSLVARAGDPSALATLCEAYWYPVYGLIRRQGYAPDRAADLTQTYFTRLIEKRTIAAADPGRGRFRAFLRADCTFFLADARDQDCAIKRGGGVRILPIDAGDAETRFGREPACLDPPERRFERDWALTVIDRALARLERSHAADRRAVFRALKPILTGEPDAARIAQVAVDAGMAEGAVRTALHRLRARFAAEIRAEVAETLADPTPEAIADELRDLFAALGR